MTKTRLSLYNENVGSFALIKKVCIGPPMCRDLMTVAPWLDGTTGNAEAQPCVWKYRHGLRGENLQVIAE